jgi:uroporphyrinogen decarboxylase
MNRTSPRSAIVSPVLRALRRQSVDRVPIWLMRQAGRYLPEYRALRMRAGDFLELCYTPALACEITLQPVRRFGMDAAILFSDILVVADAVGCRPAFVEGSGPRLEPVRDARAVAALRTSGVSARLAPVYETVQRLRQDLPPQMALIGFAGAPWTVAAYMVEGEGSKEFYATRVFAWRERETFARLIELLTEATVEHLRGQIAAGADVIQLFDSWAGILPEPEFRRWCQDPVARIVSALKADFPEVPIIAFPRGAGSYYQSFVGAVPIDGLGLDTAAPAGRVRCELPGICLQGNLDPAALLAGGPGVLREADRIVQSLARGPFIFNLGHGVLPETDPEEVAALVAHVKALPLPSGSG